MRELEGRSYQEIAEILEISVSAVETLIFRARRALREQLEEGITCHEAELAISRQLDNRLSRKDKGTLRAHLRECSECARFARSQRAQRGALKSLGAIPLPGSLASFFGGGGATAVGGGLAVKAAALGAGAIVATGVGYEGVKHGIVQPRADHHAAAAAEDRSASSSDISALAPATLAPPPVRSTTHDLKPFRKAAVAARQAAKHAGNNAKKAREAAPGRQKHIEVSTLPPSRAGRPVRTPKTKTPPRHVGRHLGRTQTRRHTPPPPPPPPPKKHAPPPQHPLAEEATPPGVSNGKSDR
jgi:hypothetical protein